MIVNLPAFIHTERPFWNELEAQLAYLEAEPLATLDLEAVKRLHYLYERTASDLNQIRERVAEGELRAYLETLTARAYGEIQSNRRDTMRFRPLHGFFVTFPRTLRRHAALFLLSSALFTAGGLLGGGMLAADPALKRDFLPFPHLLVDPSERVAMEESGMAQPDGDLMDGKTSFASRLFQHNTRVSILMFALGMTFGIGTLILLFYNGVIIGMVVADFILAGESAFLAGWLLPHGSVEIPAILIAGQAGLLLARTLIGRGTPLPMNLRLRAAGPDLLVLVGGTATLLVWAAVVEAFFSQFHAPVIPYGVKIAFGTLQLALLASFLLFGGRSPAAQAEDSSRWT